MKTIARGLSLLYFLAAAGPLQAQTSVSGAISIHNLCGNYGCDLNCKEASYYTIYAPQTACNGTAYSGNCGGGSPGTHYSTYISINIPTGCTATVTAEYGGAANYTTTCSNCKMDAGGPDLLGISSGAGANPLAASWTGTTSNRGGTSNIGTCSFGAGGNGGGATLSGGPGSTGCYTSGGSGNANVLCVAAGLTGPTDVTVWGGMNRGDEIITYTVIATGSSCPLGVSVLPIELIALSAYRAGTAVMLKWVTASEINNDYFEVQYSVDGVSFTPAGQVKGAGNSQQKKEYEFHLSEAPGGPLCFRLKQVDYNGNFKYSPIIMEGTAYGAAVTHTGFLAFYNSLTSQAVTRFTVIKSGVVDVRLYDSQGNYIGPLLRKEYQAGDYEEFTDVQLPAGIYYVAFECGGNTPVFKKIAIY